MKGSKNIATILRHRLTLQQEARTADGAGGYVRSWNNIGELWAEISSLSNRSVFGYEKLVADQIQSVITHKIIIRYRNNIITDMRLLYESRIFNIRAIKNVNENNEILELLVEEGVAN
jgi:SPP1 family predicted phage head-tail adaptor